MEVFLPGDLALFSLSRETLVCGSDGIACREDPRPSEVGLSSGIPLLIVMVAQWETENFICRWVCFGSHKLDTCSTVVGESGKK